MRIPRLLLVALLAASSSACGILYTNVKLPRGYRSSSPSDVKAAPDDPLVSGKSCSRSALYLVAWGDSSYAAAVQDALKGHDGILYDVRSDMKANAYLLGLYTKVCTVLTGKVAKP
jgi:hypothetical protein